MASEGSREIDAAKKRLAAAKAQASGASLNMNSAAKSMASAKAMMDSAKAMMENAESLIQSSSKEVKDAEKFLEEAEKRWNVIHIDQEPDSPEKKSNRKKRRKLSRSPEESSDNANIEQSSAGNDAVSLSPGSSNGDDRAVRQNSGTAVVIMEGPSTTTRTVSISMERRGQGQDYWDHWGHTVVGASGTYQQTDEKEDGVPMYRKEGFWNGEGVDFVMYRARHWFIGASGCRTLFVSRFAENSELPPRDGWLMMDKKMKLAPIVKNAKIPSYMKVSTIEVEGSGIKEVNGTYEHEYSFEGGQRQIVRQRDGVPVFVKMGEWERNPVKFVVMHVQWASGKRWRICSSSLGNGVAECVSLYSARSSANEQAPSSHGWVVCKKGVLPAPNLNWANDE